MKIDYKKLSLILASSMLFSCTSNNLELSLQPIENSQVKTFSTPEFNQRKLNALNIPTNSVSEQKKKQIKLHTYYFNSYSNGTAYSSSEDNAHIKMLKKGEATLNTKVDANNDGRITLDEINKFVSSEAYIKYFRDTYINYSYAKLDENKDKKLSMDEFNNFNSKIKDPNVADFQLLEEFADYDYNSSRNLELEEYEDFFMAYLLVKVGAEK